MSMKKHVISNATVGVWKNMFWDHMMKWSVRKESLTIHTNFLIYASFNKKNRTTTVTTGKRQFAVCPNVCRVQYIGHTANQLFAVCLHENTREIKEHSANCDVRRVRGPGTWQTPSFAVCRYLGTRRNWSTCHARAPAVRRRPRPDGLVSNGREGNEHMQKKKKKKKKLRNKMLLYLLF